MTTSKSALQELTRNVTEQLLRCTGASSVASVQHVQSLWSGYGNIVRINLNVDRALRQGQHSSVIVKYIQSPAILNHPRGWNTDASAQRKLASYRVEMNWYAHYADTCRQHCYIPALYHCESSEDYSYLILEDLDRLYPLRHSQISVEDCRPCLHWLARFHAAHFQSDALGLWPIGTYWHLATRKDEFEAMAASPLKEAAVALDEKLNQCKYKTLVHGDAKIANVCFPTVAGDVAMVDFQYVGSGCGIRDVAYFIGSCLPGPMCEQHADKLLDVYFDELRIRLPSSIGSLVEAEWRDLHPIACADFQRFILGWMPEHPKANRYAHSMTQRALLQL